MHLQLGRLLCIIEALNQERGTSAYNLGMVPYVPQHFDFSEVACRHEGFTKNRCSELFPPKEIKNKARMLGLAARYKRVINYLFKGQPSSFGFTVCWTYYIFEALDICIDVHEFPVSVLAFDPHNDIRYSFHCHTLNAELTLLKQLRQGILSIHQAYQSPWNNLETFI